MLEGKHHCACDALTCVEVSVVPRFEVARTCRIAAFLGDRYGALDEALGNGTGSGQPLGTTHLLREIDAKLPYTVTANDKATPADVAKVVRDVDEADKVHFLRFIPHTQDSGRHVTAANLAKTRRLIGQHAHDWCQRPNISTGWSDVPTNTPVPETLPKWPTDNSGN